MKFLLPTLFIHLFFQSVCVANTVNYTLEIKEGEIEVGGRAFSEKLMINNTIPGPELIFHDGDIAEIRVVNSTNKKTLLHWHGILLPNDQDGVPYVNSLPIEPRSEKIYRFPIKQTGTYWYHSHVMFQEEDGLYGAIKILPKDEKEIISEQTILLSDLTHESGATVQRNLKRDGEYYHLFKGTVQSWFKAFKTGSAHIKLRNSLERMGGMDYADVAYDFFTANGKPEISLFEAKEESNQSSKSKQVKLRIINGSASSLFKLTYAGNPMTIIAADGLAVDPVKVNILPISVAETYDVVVDLEQGKRLELRATSLDNSGHASILLGESDGKKVLAPPMPWEQPIGVTMGDMMGMPKINFWKEFAMVYKNEFSDIPRDIEYQFPQIYALPDTKTLMPMMSMMPEMKNETKHADHSSQSIPSKDMQNSNMSSMHEHDNKTSENDMSDENETGMNMKPEQSFRIMNQAQESQKNNLVKDGPQPIYNELTYGLLRSPNPIDTKPEQKLRVIPFTLNGNMENYVWTINGRALDAQTYIKINKGERVRFIMRNATMMNHPMHLHGHFFRVMTSQGRWSVLKHTVNVAPLSTTVIEFAASEEKDWFFHCHILYHMMGGMTRIVRYEDNPGSKELEITRTKSKEFNLASKPFLSTKALAQSDYYRLSGKIFTSYYQLQYDVIGNYNDDLEGEFHAAKTLTRYLNLYFGGKTVQEKGKFESSPTVGFTWILPLRIHVDVKYQPYLYRDKKFEIEFENQIQLTDKFQLNYEYSSIRKFYSELEYRQTKHLSILANYSQTYSKWGAGLAYTY